MEWNAVAGAIASIWIGGKWALKNVLKPLYKQYKEYGDSKSLQKINGEELIKLNLLVKYLDKKLEAVIALETSALFILDNQGVCVTANSAACEIFGAREEEMKGYGFFNFIHPEDQERAMRNWEIAFKNKSHDLRDSYRIIHGKTEETRIFVYHAVIPRTENGEVIVSVALFKEKFVK